MNIQNHHRPAKPARKIPVKENSIRGKTPTGEAFESLLERDFYVLLEFDPTVAEFYAQSVIVPYEDADGYPRRYFPDALVHYRPDPVTCAIRRSLLAEVKPAALLKYPTDELVRKMEAAQEFAADRGWDYQVVTEVEIRTPRLENALFLRRFHRQPPETAVREMILSRLYELGGADARALMAACYQDQLNQARVLAHIWHLVGTREICTDLDQPITMKTRLWVHRELA